MTTVFVSFGSNMGDRQAQIEQSIQLMNEIEQTSVTRISSLYETAPVGGVEQDDFLNGVAELETTLSAQDLLKALQSIEIKMNRVRKIHWGPRTLDLDIILFGTEIFEEEHLTVPHPYMHERSFVLIPLNEIAPHALHPKLNKQINELVTMDPDVRLYK